MEYKGKLYGKVGNKYFDTGYTTDEWDKLQALSPVETQTKECCPGCKKVEFFIDMNNNEKRRCRLCYRSWDKPTTMGKIMNQFDTVLVEDTNGKTESIPAKVSISNSELLERAKEEVAKKYDEICKAITKLQEEYDENGYEYPPIIKLQRIEQHFKTSQLSKEEDPKKFAQWVAHNCTWEDDYGVYTVDFKEGAFDITELYNIYKLNK